VRIFMKALTCEMCGSTEIIRENGLYGCQACGTKYSIEDAKKLMSGNTVKIEGAVKLDMSDELSNFTVLAHRATEAKDWDRAYIYYEKILLMNPDDWEANFNVQYYKTFSARQENILMEIDSRLDIFRRNIPYLNNLLAKEYSPAEYFNRIPEIWDPVVKNCNMIWNDHVTRLSKVAGFSMNDAKQKVQEEIFGYVQKNMPAIINFLTELLCNIDLTFGPIIQVWVISNAKATIVLANRTPKCDPSAIERLSALVKKYEKDYVVPKKKACYVATAVYGSYDCPEVWTLRRFRDSFLAESWYGRAFISIYYTISPTCVKWFGESRWFKNLCAVPLNKFVKYLQGIGVENTPYNDL
ncbi:MAG: hypothetical protein K2F88_08010, partial [Duncaniella sp.]|nr:hypothetical protein [Duncaniella sp.]